MTRRAVWVGLSLLLAFVGLCAEGIFIRADLPPPLAAEDSITVAWSNDNEPVDGPVARLYVAEVPHAAGFATHPWFVIREGPGAPLQRWELWQAPVGLYGHVAVDLLAPEASVEGGPTRLVQEFQGAEASRIIAVLTKRAALYPCRGRYHYWPGPNSNTFARWVLDEAGLSVRLPASSFGAGWSCR